jgi:hypothetical protein
MSFLDTIALPLFIAIVGLIALVFVAAWAYTQAAEARSKMLARKRDLRLEREAYELVENLFIEVNSSDDLSAALPDSLHSDLWKLHNQINLKGLVR